jgi:hypothetical protein
MTLKRSALAALSRWRLGVQCRTHAVAASSCQQPFVRSTANGLNVDTITMHDFVRIAGRRPALVFTEVVGPLAVPGHVGDGACLPPHAGGLSPTPPSSLAAAAGSRCWAASICSAWTSSLSRRDDQCLGPDLVPPTRPQLLARQTYILPPDRLAPTQQTILRLAPERCPGLALCWSQTDPMLAPYLPQSGAPGRLQTCPRVEPQDGR